MKKIKGGFAVAHTIILVGVLVLTVMALSYFSNKTEIEVPKPIEEVRVSTTTQDIPEKSTWTTYQNSLHKFEVKYPPYLVPRKNDDKYVQVITHDIGIFLENTNKDLNVAWADVSFVWGARGSISYDAATKGIETQQFSADKIGGNTRVLKTFMIGNKRAMTYENIGYPSRVPSITTIIEADEYSTFEVYVYGKSEIDMNALEQGDFSAYKDLEDVHNDLLSTFRIIE